MTASLGREWLPLVWQLYDDVAARVQRYPAFTHLLDQALLCLELRRALGEDCGAADPRQVFRQAMAALGREPAAGPWLYRGAAQAGWLAVQLAQETAVGPDTRVAGLARIDALVLDWLLDYPDTADVDLPRGVLGLGVYGLAHPDPVVRETVVGGVLDVLGRRVERDGAGVFIRLADTPERRGDGSARCRIVGVAHGTAGLVGLLSHVVLAGADQADRARSLLAEALPWLLAQRLADAPGLFPHRVESAPAPARPTWCSGDLGIGLVLPLAAAASGAVEALTTADDVAASLARRPAADCGVVDACLCHGAAGLCWYGHRRHAETGDPAGAAMARYWAEWVAAKRADGPLRYFGPRGMVPDPSFLEGDTGIALVLLQAVVGGPACWEQLVLAAPARVVLTA